MARWTGRADGDQRGLGTGPDAGTTDPVRRLRQVHGARVLVVGSPRDPAPDGPADLAAWSPDDDGRPPAGDAIVARAGPGRLAVLTADCAALALGSPEGVHGAVHAGWRGLGAGVIERSVTAARALGASTVVAGLGPCIGPCCYEFSPADLDPLAALYGSSVVGRTSVGRPALDLPAAVRAALARVGVDLVHDGAACTACTAPSYSHRARAEPERQALLVWAETGPP